MPARKYPAILEKSSGEVHPLGKQGEFTVGRSPDADLPLLDVRCSRQQFRVLTKDRGHQLEALSRNSATYVNGRKADPLMPLEHGSVIQAGDSIFVFLTRDDAELARRPSLAVQAERTQLSEGSNPGRDDRTMLISAAAGSSLEAPEQAPLEGEISLRGNQLIGRDQERAGIHLPHAQVSRIHAQIATRDKAATLTDLNSANGTFVNGNRISLPTTLRPGDKIDIGPYALLFTGSALVTQSRVDNVELACLHLTQTVRDRTSGRRVNILDDVNLVIRPREFVCLLGPSGSGKSTLLSALSARQPASSGKVTINGTNLYDHFEALKRDIAVVPQKDVLHDFLEVQTALSYTAKLRLPPDTSVDEVEDTVSELLRTVGLSERSRTPLRFLSGGQVKRASLANEIVSRPSLLFLDEVTSGLDEQTDGEMMKLFRQVADSGKTVVCITHNLTNVEQFCHRVVILTEGGKLAFVGSPAEAVSYFGVERLGGVYEQLKTKPAEQWQREFLGSSQHKKLVAEQASRPTTGEHVSRFQSRQTFPQTLRFIARQSGLLTSRYFRIQLKDLQSILVTLGQCLLVGLLIILLFGDISDEPIADQARHASTIVFLLGISMLWFGCNNAAKEIVKERTIYLRERDVNLTIPSYLGSKVAWLGFVSLLQTIILFSLVCLGTRVECGLAHFSILLTLAFAGINLGLLVSAIAQTTDMAVTTVPLLLIPQIIFSGALATVSGISKWLASLLIVAYWGHGGLVACLPEDQGKLCLSEEWSPFWAWLVVAFHASCYLAGTAVVLYLGSVRTPVYRQALQKWRAALLAGGDQASADGVGD